MAAQSATETEELTLYGLFALFIRNWLILVVSGFSVAILALIWAINQPNVYTSSTLLMPASDESGSLSGLAGNLGGLAAMAGVSLPEGEKDNTVLALELIKTQAFLGDFIVENELTVPIMAAEDWDKETNTLVINPEVYDQSANKWVRSPPPSRKVIPSIQETYEAFLKLIVIEQDPKTNFVTLSVDFYSPYLAAEWTNKLVNKLNHSIRLRDKEEATESIAYLEKLLLESNIQGVIATFSALMEEQVKSQMLTEVRKDYVFKVVEPAIVPELKSKPRRSLIIILAGFIGGIIGMIVILFKEGRRSHLARQQNR